MYLNRVLMEFRATAPEHKDWVLAVKDVMAAVQSLAESHCPGGLVWGAGSGSGAAVEAPAAAAASEPAPKPRASAHRNGATVAAHMHACATLWTIYLIAQGSHAGMLLCCIATPHAAGCLQVASRGRRHRRHPRSQACFSKTSRKAAQAVAPQAAAAGAVKRS